VLDGYEPEVRIDDPRVRYLQLEPTRLPKKRQGINAAVEVSRGEYLMSLDAHCMMDEGFDEKLVADMQDDWVMIPRRQRLDAENWCLQTQSDKRPPIDYEYIMYPPKFDEPGFHGFRWDARTFDRWEIPLDDTIEFQGSCWLMTRRHFERHGFMDLRYQGWGQEAEEISFTTWLTGGRVVTNKKTWYAHLHKGKTYGRMYYLDKGSCRKSYRYCYDFWINDRSLPGRIHSLDWLIDKFMPMPGWPVEWKL